MLALADRSADWVDQALRDLEQAEQSMQAARHEWACFAAQQAWGHTLTRLWAVLPQQDWQPPPPEDLEDRLRLLNGFYINSAERHPLAGGNAGGLTNAAVRDSSN